jgi:hypothetical protein
MERPPFFDLYGIPDHKLDQLTQAVSEQGPKEVVAETKASPRAPLVDEELPMARSKDSTRPAESGAIAAKSVAASSSEYVPQEEPSIRFEQFAHARVAKPNPAAQSIIRTALAKSILADLRSIQQYAGSAMAAAYAAPLLKTMRTMRDLVPYDPYVKVVMALYDAMAYENRWADYDAEQYQGARQTLGQLAKQTSIDRRDVAKAILELEERGFNTTPFGMPATEED